MIRRPRWRLGLRDAVILTAPLLAVIGYLALAAATDFYRALQFDDYWAEGIGAERQFVARAGALLHLLPEQRLKHRINLEPDDPGRVRLQVAPAVLDAAYRDPQLGWTSWLKGDLVEDGRLLPVDVHKRGDNSVHWLTEKKTVTVRTSRDEFYKRYRRFGLSAKDVLPSYVANRLAREFDLLAPQTTVVPVVLNNQFAGMYRFIEVVDESFLRPFDRMPGNIFRGDAAERGDYFKGVPRDLFADPYIWDRVAVSDRPTGPGSDQLRLFIEDLNGGDFAAHQRLMARLDRGEISRLVAFLLLVGDPYHMDGVHNQLWYEDPSTSQLHPIPWDIRLLPLEELPQRELNGFLHAVLRDPWVVDGVLRELGHRVATPRWVGLADSLARSVWDRYHDEFAFDSLRARLIPPLGHPDEVHRVLAGNLEVVRGWLANAEVRCGSGPVLDLETRGFAGLDLVGLEVSGGGARMAVRSDRNRNGILDAEDPTVAGSWEGTPVRRFVPTNPPALLAAWNTSAGQPNRPGLSPGTQHYRFFLEHGGPGTTVRPLLRNRYTGAAVECGPWIPGNAIAVSASWHPWRFPPSSGRMQRWSGVVHLNADLRLAANDTLEIEPGTTVRLDPDVSLISRGRVLAEGTAARPITFTRADPVRPWGAFSLLGEGADSSRFRFVTFEWGGGALVDRVEYTGMVNVHRARGVLVEHSVFRDNLRSDDTFHALHAEVTIRQAQFLRANSDALDLDISSGLIEDNSFEGSGGDAIDLMTSTPVIRNNRIQDSRDKGISVGEASRPLIVANRIARCARGIEVKDRSEPLILDNELTQNGVALYEDRKNWRYGGGGWATLLNTALGNNRDSLRLDPFSRITSSNDPAIAALLQTTPLMSVRFEEDFAPGADGWRAANGVTRVAKEDRSLYAAVEGRSGLLGRPLHWDLRRQAGPARLLLQAASRDLDSAEVTLVSPEGRVRRRLALGGDPARFGVTVVELPPRLYTAMVISLLPRPRIEKRIRATRWTELKPGAFWLRGYDLFPAGSASPARPGQPTS
ncbi:MAG TPA: right-handed parallel beta-helix repeat-containing protein [Gemmatimonadales bacterium]|nr:right-handed parallel beta-helix repeat-containing protein [Gemmatimonadales bacterium]